MEELKDLLEKITNTGSMSSQDKTILTNVKALIDDKTLLEIINVVIEKGKWFLSDKRRLLIRMEEIQIPNTNYDVAKYKKCIYDFIKDITPSTALKRDEYETMRLDGLKTKDKTIIKIIDDICKANYKLKKDLKELLMKHVSEECVVGNVVEENSDIVEEVKNIKKIVDTKQNINTKNDNIPNVKMVSNVNVVPVGAIDIDDVNNDDDIVTDTNIDEKTTDESTLFLKDNFEEINECENDGNPAELIDANCVMVEKQLDETIERYNYFTESYPACNVSLSEDKKYYSLKYGNIRKKSKNISVVIKMLKNILMKVDNNEVSDSDVLTDQNVQNEKENKKNFSKILSPQKKNFFDKKIKWANMKPCRIIKYRGKTIILYAHDSKMYFDLSQTLSLMGLKNLNDKYFKCSHLIEIKDTRDNIYGGFYVKEFISQESFYNILLNSTTTFARDFKKDVSVILDKLTVDGMIIVENDKFQLNPAPHQQLRLRTSGHMNTILSSLVNVPGPDDVYCAPETIDNLLLFIQSKIINIQDIDVNKYAHKQLIYMCVMDIEDPQGKNRLLCKIGYSNDIYTRCNSLLTEYKCNLVFFIGLRENFTMSDEHKLHLQLKKIFPRSVVEMSVGTTEKTEIYVFEKKIYDYFMAFGNRTPNIEINPYNTIIELVKNNSSISDQILEKCLETIKDNNIEYHKMVIEKDITMARIKLEETRIKTDADTKIKIQSIELEKIRAQIELKKLESNIVLLESSLGKN